MRTILPLLRKDFLGFFRNKAAVSLTFIVPFAMIYLFGQIFGVNRKDSGPSGIPLAVVNTSDNPAATKLIDALKREKAFSVVTEYINPDQSRRPLTEADLAPLMQLVRPPFRFALVIPADLIPASGVGLHLKFLSNPRNEIETQTVNGILQKTIFANVPELLGQSLQARAQHTIGATGLDSFNERIAQAVGTSFGGDPAEIKRTIAAGGFGLDALTGAGGGSSSGAGASGDMLSQLIQLDREQVVGAKIQNLAATNLVGGWAIQFLLFALAASATSLFRERDAGIFQRLLASPVTRTQILWSKFLYGVLLGLLQLMVLFAASSVLYGIQILPHLGLLIVMCVFAAAACTSFGMLVAACTRSQEAAMGLSTFLVMIMSALGGAWFPITLMPLFMQKFSQLTLVYWSMEGFSAVLWSGNSLLQILPILGILGGITAAVMSVAVWRFNRGNLFG